MSENKSLCERIENRIGTYDNASIRAILKHEIEWALDEQEKELGLLLNNFPFTIEVYQKLSQGYEVVTRSGLKVKVVTVSANPNTDFPVVAFVYDGGNSVPYSFTRFGTFYRNKESALDLYIRHK